MGLPLNILFPMGLWQLWLHWNAYVYRSDVEDSNAHQQCIKKGS